MGKPLQKVRTNGRTQCIGKYEHYLRSRQDLLDKLFELEGKHLVCHCKPLACYGDILLKLFIEITEH